MGANSAGIPEPTGRVKKMRKKTIVNNLVRLRSSSSSFSRRSCLPSLPPLHLHHPSFPSSSDCLSFGFKPSSFFPCSSSATLRFLNTNSFDHKQQDDPFQGLLPLLYVCFVFIFNLFLHFIF